MFPTVNFVFALILKLSFLVLVKSHHCPEIYLRFSKQHSYCQPRNSSCPIFEILVSPEDVAIILKQHNLLRNKVATGQESGLPEGSNLLQMVWDQELADVAQKRAEQCIFEHDCLGCRRVRNFAVGQNIAHRIMTCGPQGCPDQTPTKTDWVNVIQDFYDEVKDFDRSRLNKFARASGSKVYEHFTQLVWAETWRVGCGFVTYKLPGGYRQLYMCNYGPAGNVNDQPVYKPGKICSGCPKNSCCGQNCGNSEFPGLCKMLQENEAPIYNPEKESLFYCDFAGNRPDCKFTQEGIIKWNIIKTLDGPFIEVVGLGGTSSSIIFDKFIRPKSSSFCLRVQYKAGPLVDGQNAAHSIDLILQAQDATTPKMQLKPNPEGDLFFTYSLDLSWNFATKIGFKFSVPELATPQYLNIKDISATDGPCSK